MRKDTDRLLSTTYYNVIRVIKNLSSGHDNNIKKKSFFLFSVEVLRLWIKEEGTVPPAQLLNLQIPWL